MVKQIEVVRLEKSDQGLLGVLLIEGKIFCYTLEHPTLALKSGTYPADYEHSPKFDRGLYELKCTGERDQILFHVGNTMDDSSGCILLGCKVGYIDKKRAVLSSGDTIDRFHSQLKGETLQVCLLDITGL